MLLRAPASWPVPVVAAVAMLLLAVVDLAGAYATKEAVLRRSPGLAAAGAALFLLLFYLYACSLQYAELALVTLGWVVALQVGVVLLDRFRYGATMPAGKWVAVGVVLLAQGYLLLAPSSPAEAAAPDGVPPHIEVSDGVPARQGR
jgi:hypothetical protein